MSSHDWVMAMIDEKLDKERKTLVNHLKIMEQTEKTLERQRGEKQLIEQSIRDLEHSKATLMFDTHANAVNVMPEVP